MSNQKLFSIYDRKAQYYLPLMQHRSQADAIREFTGLVVNSETPLATYPADFDLIELGDFDQVVGTIVPNIHPVPVINGLVALQNAQTERSRYQRLLVNSDGSVGAVGEPDAA